MKKMIELFFFYSAMFISAFVYAGSPVFTLTPLTPTTLQVPANGSATVEYLVQNQSSKTHAIIMASIPGITQITSTGNCPNPFTLTAKQSCTLVLQINGNQIASHVNSGPVMCQQGVNGQPDPLFCYQPSVANSLNISIGNPITYYSGTQDGNVYYSLNYGTTWTATVMPGGGSSVNSIFVANNILYAATANGSIYYSSNNGNSWNSTTQPDGSAVKSVFVTNNILYAATANGTVYYSSNNGNSWNSTAQPDGSAVNSIFVTGNTLYVGTANGNVFYSTDNGVTWTSINGQADGSGVQNVFVNNGTLYIDTANEYVYSSTALTGGGTWTTVAQTVYSLFVNPADNSLYAGTQNGHVFSITNGTQLGFVTYSPINSFFISN